MGVDPKTQEHLEEINLEEGGDKQKTEEKMKMRKMMTPARKSGKRTVLVGDT